MSSRNSQQRSSSEPEPKLFVPTSAIVFKNNTPRLLQEAYLLQDVNCDDGEKLTWVVTSASREKLFDLFMNRIRNFNSREVQVCVDVLKHKLDKRDAWQHPDFSTEMEPTIIASHLEEYEELLMEDGYLGVSVDDGIEEVRLWPDKMLGVCRTQANLREELRVMRAYEIPHNPDLELPRDLRTEYHTTPEFGRAFRALAQTLNLTKYRARNVLGEDDDNEGDEWQTA